MKTHLARLLISSRSWCLLATLIVLACRSLLATSHQNQEPVPELKVQFGHSFAIAGVAFSPSGKFALTAGNEGGVSLWDIESGALLKKFETQGKAALFSPDERFILTSGENTTLWDAATLQPIRR